MGPGWTCRAAAVLTVVTASLVCVECTSGAQTPVYGVVLAGALTVASLTLAALMWRRHTFRTAIAADTLALLTMITQLLVAMVGSPGNVRPEPHWSVAAIGVVASAFTVLVLLAADSPYAPGDDERDHPYAL